MSADQQALFLKPPLGKANKNVVRDFLYGCWCNGKRIGGMQMPPLNELYAATHCRQDGLETSFIDAHMEPHRYDALLANRFDGVMAVAIMSSTQSFRDDIRCFEEIREIRPDITTILFGSHPTFMPDASLEEESIDYVVLGEPEESLRVLLGAILNGDTIGKQMLGVGYKDAAGKPTVNPDRPFIGLNELPIPDRTLLPVNADYFNPVVKRVPYTTMQTSRGCPARCTYCTAPVFYGNKTRVRSAELVLEEMRQIKDLGYREIFFRDETFSAYKGRNLTIFEGMKREGLDFSWIANGRVDMITREMMIEMKDAGCHMMKFGVESGDDQILENYKKGATSAQAIEAFRYAKEVGMDTHAHMVFGGPGETLDTIKATMKFIKKLKPTTVTFGILTPYPGTELFNQVAAVNPEIKDGTMSTMENLHTSGFFSEAMCGISGEELSRQIVSAYREFYMRPSYLFDRLTKVRSFEELMISVIAGSQVLQFAVTGKK